MVIRITCLRFTSITIYQILKLFAKYKITSLNCHEDHFYKPFPFKNFSMPTLNVQNLCCRIRGKQSNLNWNFPEKLSFLNSVKYLKIDHGTSPRWDPIDLKIFPNIIDIYYHFSGSGRIYSHLFIPKTGMVKNHSDNFKQIIVNCRISGGLLDFKLLSNIDLIYLPKIIFMLQSFSFKWGYDETVQLKSTKEFDQFEYFMNEKYK